VKNKMTVTGIGLPPFDEYITGRWAKKYRLIEKDTRQISNNLI